jgi:hypothetical protein
MTAQMLLLRSTLLLSVACDVPEVDGDGAVNQDSGRDGDTEKADSAALDSGSCAEPDEDGDGVDSIACGGSDCDDAQPQRFPENAERCDSENVDEDCNANTFGEQDLDRDGYDDARCCNNVGTALELCGSDCDDSNPAAHASEAESCDGDDNDCDGLIDEDVTTEYWLDCDGDGFGAGDQVDACAPPTPLPECGGRAWARVAGDCDDESSGIHPGATELCDRIDTDCDGALAVFEDADGDGVVGCMTSLTCAPADAPDCNDTDPATTSCPSFSACDATCCASVCRSIFAVCPDIVTWSKRGGEAGCRVECGSGSSAFNAGAEFCASQRTLHSPEVECSGT